MAGPHEYPFIRAWGKMLGSNEDFIFLHQKRASEEGAPQNAIYYSDEKGRWVTFDEIGDATVRGCVSQLAKTLTAHG